MDKFTRDMEGIRGEKMEDRLLLFTFRVGAGEVRVRDGDRDGNGDVTNSPKKQHGTSAR